MTDSRTPTGAALDGPPRIFLGLPAWASPAAFAALLATVALAWLPAMRHATYIRESLLVGLAAPAVAALGLLFIGPTRSGLAAALAGWPARLFLAAVWGHALLAWASLAWTTSPESATHPRGDMLQLHALGVSNSNP